jgi:hypothetical protein
MSRKRVAIGSRSGRLVVLGLDGYDSAHHRRWKCRCDCGQIVTITGYNLFGRTNSCGCLKRELTAKRMAVSARKHGGSKSPEYRAWVGMRRRCRDSGERGKHWAGRGIRVCEEWEKSFEAFLAHVGSRPSEEHSLDRVNNDGNYEPGNVRWATQKQQMRNRRSVHLVMYQGRTQTISEWADELRIPTRVIGQRLLSGWSDEKALDTPYHPRFGSDQKPENDATNSSLVAEGVTR